MKIRNLSAIYVISAVATLTGCGGGGGSDNPTPTPTPTPTTSAEGIWDGTTNITRDISGIVTNTGEYWVIYTVEGNSNILAGFIQGNGGSGNGQFSSNNLRDFNFEGLGVLSGSVSANYMEKEKLDGSVNYPSLSQTTNFSSTYNPDYEITPTLAAVAGNYTGSLGSEAGPEFGTLNIAETGSFTATGSSGCMASGNIAPNDVGNIYDVTLTFNGGVCALGTETVSGVAYYSSGQILVALINNGRTVGALYLGTRN